VASWQFDWLTKRWIVIGMAGAAIPDLVKLGITLDDDVIESILGMPFSYSLISSLGGVLLIAGAITVFFQKQRRRVFLFLLFAGFTSLVVDGLRVFADGRSGILALSIHAVASTHSEFVCDIRYPRAHRSDNNQCCSVCTRPLGAV
jgi:hypothetical protein